MKWKQYAFLILNFLAVTLFAGQLLAQPISEKIEKEGSGSHGGDNLAQEFTKRAILTIESKSLYISKQEYKALQKALKKTKVLTTDKPLCQNNDCQTGIEFISIQKRDIHTIIINRNKWDNLSSYEKNFHALHEFAGMANLETDAYHFTANLMDKVHDNSLSAFMPPEGAKIVKVNSVLSIFISNAEVSTCEHNPRLCPVYEEQKLLCQRLMPDFQKYILNLPNFSVPGFEVANEIIPEITTVAGDLLKPAEHISHMGNHSLEIPAKYISLCELTAKLQPESNFKIIETVLHFKGVDPETASERTEVSLRNERLKNVIYIFPLKNDKGSEVRVYQIERI